MKVLNLNVVSMFALTRACTPLLEKAANGNLAPAHVINIGSVAGAEFSEPQSITPSYSASKAAVGALTRYLAAKLVGKHINVNCIGPALFESKMTKYLLTDEQAIQKKHHEHPVGRMGNETDLAGLSLFLATKASAFVTGSTIYLDGGLVHIRGRSLI